MKHNSRKSWDGDKADFYNYSNDVFKPFKKLPTTDSSYVIKVTNWANVPRGKSLWVGIYYSDNYVILDSEVIIKLAEELKKLKRIK